MSRTKQIFRWSSAGVLLVAATLAGCDRNDVKVYRLAKDTSPQQPAAAPAQSDVAGEGQNAAAPLPRLTWTLPEGWQEKAAGEMRAASFAISGKSGQQADVSIIPLPSGGPELDLVNMWREQMRLPAVAGDAAGTEAQPVLIGSDSGKLFDIASEEPIMDGKTRARILVAMVSRGATSWFFKMKGEESFVRDQKPVFVEFLKSITFAPGVAAEPAAFADPHQRLSTNAKESPTDNPGKPAWVVPSGWRETAPAQFQLAKFETGAGDGKADISVSMLGGTGGGLSANVNRWRRQLGLDPLDEDNLGKLVESIDTEAGKAQLVDMKGKDAKTGQAARTVGAVVPLGGQTWFYKLMGDETTVGREKENFLKFVQTVKYPNVP
ncbi:MAG TPA: hypothetical protein VFD66_05875 [Verrucomicrobiae bacterium]|nr:hypothetical protein [Verrucomicrobiae bacterium]